MTNRRNFLLGATALAVSGPAFAKKSVPLGLQLYTVRQDLTKDYEGTMKKVRDIGIRHVQANLTNSGKPAQDQKKLYDSLGISWKSGHAGGNGLRDNGQATTDQAKAAGIPKTAWSVAL